MTPKGKRIRLHVEGDIPYLIVGNDPACPTVNEIEAVAQAPADEAEECEDIEDLEVAEQPKTKDSKLRTAANSTIHLLTRVPSNPYCKVCQSAKMRQAGAYRVKPEDKRIAKVFGERVHGDLCFPCEQNEENTDQDRDDSKTCVHLLSKMTLQSVLVFIR